MRTKIVLVAALALALVAGVVAYTVYGSAASVALSQAPQGKPAALLSRGETLTLTSIAGGYRLAGTSVNGSASATFSLSVDGVFRSGYSLTPSGGSIAFAGASYIIEGGSAVAGVHLRHFSGTLETTGGYALFGGSLIGRINGVYYYRVHVDLVSSSGEYFMTFFVSVSP
jgi:hypothetical protein